MKADISKIKPRFFNTATRQVDEFIPLVKGKAGMYCCGPTVYSYAHIGNLRTYIFEDVLKRTLQGLGYEVKHVMNITDVGHLQSDGDEGDDKMSVAARREQKSPWEIARFYEKAFFDSTKKLMIKRPDVVSRATEHIPEMINLVSSLLEKGFAYEAQGNIYFDVAKFPRYGDFARLKLDDNKEARVDEDKNKRNQADFVLWFSQSKYPNQIMKWDSPFGVGFPGWHIECSAMAMKYLGERVDIHCGGVDHIPVHHTNEIAQSECSLGHKWVNYWIHGEFLNVDDSKMSKSKGGVLTIDRLIEDGFHPLAYRYLILTSHYRSGLNFNYEILGNAQNAYKALYDKVQELRKIAVAGGDDKPSDEAAMLRYSTEFWNALADDLKTSAAVQVAWCVARDETLSAADRLTLLTEFDTVFGLKLSDEPEALAADEQALLDERAAARAAKNWGESDRLRDELLTKYGVQIKDTADGVSWTRVLPKVG